MDSERVELVIESLAAGGDGVGRAPDGRVVFVPFTAPGDRVRARITRRRKRFCNGVAEEVLEPGRSRTDPLCAVYGACGGCSWQHVDYAVQLEAKRGILRDALERLGGLVLSEAPEVLACPRPYGYRGRTRVLANHGRVGYRRRRSHKLCATERCPVLVPELDEALLRLSRSAPSEVGEWELVAGCDGASRAVPLARPLADGPRIEVDVDGDRIGFSPGVFLQANPLLYTPFARHVHEAAGGGRRGVELFAGAGFFTVGLARRFRELVVVESEGRAVADLQRNLEAAGQDTVQVVGGRVEQVLAGLPRPVDAAVLDPPRTGLPPGTVDALAELAPTRLVYVSCEPATLARDLAELVRAGFRFEGVRGIDLFPQTPHLEAVATMAR